MRGPRGTATLKTLKIRSQGSGVSDQESGAKSQESEEEPDLAGPRRGPAPGPSSRGQKVICLLPGPVTIAPEVHAAFHRMPIYHRGPDFLDLFEKVRGRLARMVGCRNVAIFNGSGTLGNEGIAATLAWGTTFEHEQSSPPGRHHELAIAGLPLVLVTPLIDFAKRAAH